MHYTPEKVLLFPIILLKNSKFQERYKAFHLQFKNIKKNLDAGLLLFHSLKKLKKDFLCAYFFIILKYLAVNKIPLGDTGYLSKPYFLRAAQGSSCFYSPPFHNTVS